MRIGIDLGGTNIAAGIVDENNNIVCEKSMRTRRDGTPDNIADDMCDLVGELLHETGKKIDDIAIVGIGVPGSVNEEGIIEDTNNLPLNDIDFAALIKKRLNVPVKLINDAKAAALAEYEIGAGKGSGSFLMITLGTGVGGAYILNGMLMNGVNGAAGEIGHMVIKSDGLECTCGRRGCFEMYASASALCRKMQDIVSKNHDSLLYELCDRNVFKLDGKLFFKAVEAKDETALKILSEYIDDLAIGVTNLINIFQPEILCIGGGISGAGELLLEPLRSRVYENIYSQHSKKKTTIKTATLCNDAGILGAALVK